MAPIELILLKLAVSIRSMVMMRSMMMAGSGGGPGSPLVGLISFATGGQGARGGESGGW